MELIDFHFWGLTLFQIQIFTFFAGILAVVFLLIIAKLSNWNEYIILSVIVFYIFVLAIMMIFPLFYFDNLDILYIKKLTVEMLFPGMISAAIPIYFIISKLGFNQYKIKKTKNE
jgi:hypothetical protein